MNFLCPFCWFVVPAKVWRSTGLRQAKGAVLDMYGNDCRTSSLKDNGRIVKPFALGNSPDQKARVLFRCRRQQDGCVVADKYIIHVVLVGAPPLRLDRALQRWSESCGEQNRTFVIAGKTVHQGKSMHLHHAVNENNSALETSV